MLLETMKYSTLRSNEINRTLKRGGNLLQEFDSTMVARTVLYGRGGILDSAPLPANPDSGAGITCRVTFILPGRIAAQ